MHHEGNPGTSLRSVSVGVSAAPAPPPASLRSEGPMQVGCVSPGPSASTVPALPVSPAQLPCAEAWFLSLAPMPSFPFTARLRGGRFQERTPVHTKRNVVWGSRQRVLGQAPDCLVSFCQLHRPRHERVTSSLKKRVAGGCGKGGERDKATACCQVRAGSSGTHRVQELCFSSAGLFGALPQWSEASPDPLKAGGQGHISDFGR